MKKPSVPAMFTSVLLAVLVVIVISCLCYFVTLAQAKWKEWHDDVVEETEVGLTLCS